MSLSVAVSYASTKCSEIDQLRCDISFEYKLDLDNIKKSKIGSVEVDKILYLYYLSLYKKALEKTGPDDNVLNMVQELVPDFRERPALLKQLIMQSGGDRPLRRKQ